MGRRDNATESRVLQGRDPRSIRVLVPDCRGLDQNFHDVTIVDMGDLPESHVSKTLSAVLQLQHDAGLILSNVQVLQQLVTALNRTSSDVMRAVHGRRPFPTNAMHQVMPSYRVRRAAHYMTAMGLWRLPIAPEIRGPLPLATCNACMSCSDCFPDVPLCEPGGDVELFLH